MTFRIFMDADGVPYSEYGIYRGLKIGRQQSNLAVAERGLWYWNTFGLGDENTPVLLSYNWTQWPVNRDCEPGSAEEARLMLLNCAEWLLSAMERRHNFLIWPYPYPFSYNTKPGWCSAHSQAVGIQLLLRAGKLSGKECYLAPINGLLTAFEVPIEKGGLVDVSDPDVVWFEKFASPGNQRPKVLNGTMFALLGLADIRDWRDDLQAASLFERGLDAVVRLLPCFDLGDWSAYDILGKRASPHYHQIHIKQLDWLASMTDSSILRKFQERFIAYEEEARLKKTVSSDNARC